MEKTNRCDQCNFVSYWAVALRTIRQFMQVLWGHIWRCTQSKSHCDFASLPASNLRTHMKSQTGFRSEVPQVQPMWLYNSLCKCIKSTFKDAHKQKVKHLRTMWFCICSHIWRLTLGKSHICKCSQCSYTSFKNSMWEKCSQLQCKGWLGIAKLKPLVERYSCQPMRRLDTSNNLSVGPSCMWRTWNQC